MYRIFLTLSVCSLLLACSSNPDKKEDSVSEKSQLDLEKVVFQTEIPTLYQKHIVNNYDIEYDSTRDEKITDEQRKYQINSMMFEALAIKVPSKELGYRFVSSTVDSLANFQNLYFHKVVTLTDTNKKTIAFYAESEVKNPKLRDSLLNEIKKKYGKPKYEFLMSPEFNKCSYEWDLKDRVIQLVTSTGHGFTATSNETSSDTYYRMDLLVIQKAAMPAIYNAHVIEVPEKIKYQGKWHSYKDLQLKRKNVISDDFLLNSYYEDYVKDEYGEYNISKAKDLD